MRFKHFLISRFNVQYLEMVPYNLKMDPERWLSERIQLFFDYCYPSVINQRCNNFTWLVYFDPRTPEKELEIISSLDTKHIIQFRFSDHWSKMDKDILDFISKDVELEKTDVIISTRLDCDDAIADYFMGAIQKEFSNQYQNLPLAINPLKGLILDRRSGVVHLKKMRSNPFISLVQSADDMDVSIFGRQHQEITETIKSIDLLIPKMWLQIVHGNNLLNKPSGMPLLGNDLSLFHIKDAPNVPKGNMLLYSFLKYLMGRMNNLFIKTKRRIGLKA
ncbi:putative rhamnosyl transferase [Echinicola marina]|uniref:glycosyltransferase n=1 Tax=Echinicola marina TaxID=2859768 RepID=UPI001CF63AF9|nr:glycosyltransferase [Echinicola marina]UCS91982.1 putative rhamnosyl transferase [Echinicola marina]